MPKKSKVSGMRSGTVSRRRGKPRPIRSPFEKPKKQGQPEGGAAWRRALRRNDDGR